jgi:PAS domain S-box-containing protein
MRVNRLFNTVRPFITAAAIIAVAGILVFAVYFTLFSIQWITFLTGVLVAAVLAEATRLSRAEWVAMRRTAQVSALKDRLEHEAQLRKSLEEAAAADKMHLQLLDEVLPTMVVFVDTTGICRYSNHAFRDWLKLRPEQINGHKLSEIFGNKVYQEIASYVRQSLDGQFVKYERVQKMPSGAIYKLAVEHRPQFAAPGKAIGFYILSEDITEPSDAVAYATAYIGTANQELYVNSFSEQVTGQKDAAAEIVAAIERNEFNLLCQQIAPLSASPGAAEHLEILVRLKEEEKSMMPPGAFFPLAEKHGMLSQLDRWVVQQVVERVAGEVQQKAWHEGSAFFLNVAESTIADDTFPDYLEVTLLEYGVPGGALCFEVANTVLGQRKNEVARFAQRMKQQGCKVALSGFGRDKVSFDLIRGFQVEYLKIDGSVILNMLRDPVQLAKVIAIDKVAKQIGVKTIAEFVENGEIVAKLKEVGVDFAQGFGVSQPHPLAERAVGPPAPPSS